MATSAIQIDRTAVQGQTLEVCRQLLEELGSHHQLARLSAASHLERDLGLGSLERVELLLRLDATFGIQLPDHVVAEADTVADLVSAVLGQSGQPAVEGEPDLFTPELAAVRRAPLGSSPTAVVESAESLTELLERHAQATPQRPQIFLREDDRGESRRPHARVITYGELRARAAHLGAALAARGLAPGETVAIMLPTSAEFFFAFFGVLLAGGVPVPIYPPFRADRIAEYAERQVAILRNAEARFLVTFREAEKVARLLKPQVESLAGVITAAKLLESRETHPLRHRARGDEIAFLQYTSGSTGDPKGVVLTHANLLANMRSIAEALEVRAADVGVSWLPLYHDMGLIGAWLTMLACGVPLAVLSPLAFLTRPERWLWAVHHHRGTLSAAPNFAYELCVRKIADRDIEGLDLSSWRGALNGAEPVNPETLERFSARFARYGFRPEAMLPVYGLAEATLAVTVPPLGRTPRIDSVDRETFERDGRAVPADEAGDARPTAFVSAGRPVPGFEVRIVDGEGREVPECVEGQLWFRGTAATSGYYRNPDATRAILRGDGWVDSGDRAYQADGEIFITGRVKDMIIKAGRNIYPHEVEEAAGRAEGVRRGCAVAFGLVDRQAGTERLVVVAEMRAGRSSDERAQIAAAIGERVADAVGLPPDAIELVPPHSIPKTSSGKLRRNETRKLYLEGKLGAGQPPVWVQVAKLGAASGTQTLGATLRRATEKLWGVYALAVFSAIVVPTWLLAMLAPGRRLANRITSLGCRACLALSGCPPSLEGRDNLPQGAPLVFVANHTSYLDVIALLATVPAEYRFVAKMEVHGMPFIRGFIRKCGHLTFDRADRRARLEQMNEIEEFLRAGDSVFVFPEGTFTPAPGVRPFQLGAFKAAITSGRPIVPVAVRGVREVLRDETWLPRPGRIGVTILPPIFPDADSEASDWQQIVRLRDATRAAIAENCGEPAL